MCLQDVYRLVNITYSMHNYLINSYNIRKKQDTNWKLKD